MVSDVGGLTLPVADISAFLTTFVSNLAIASNDDIILEGMIISTDNLTMAKPTAKIAF